MRKELYADLEVRIKLWSELYAALQCHVHKSTVQQAPLQIRHCKTKEAQWVLFTPTISYRLLNTCTCSRALHIYMHILQALFINAYATDFILHMHTIQAPFKHASLLAQFTLHTSTHIRRCFEYLHAAVPFTHVHTALFTHAQTVLLYMHIVHMQT